MAAFSWRVAIEGYQWKPTVTAASDEDDGADPDPLGHVLSPVVIAFQTYNPLEDTGLFRTFAATLPTLEGVLSFANRFGSLGDDMAEPDEPPEPPENLNKQELRDWKRELVLDLSMGDRFATWHEAIEKMRSCVNVWENTKQPSRWRNMQKVIELINRQLNRNRVEFSLDRIRDERTCDDYALRIVPSNLLGALWLQLARAIADKKEFRSCRECGRWFELSPEVNRSSRLTCSEGCRSRAYRKRKERAWQLATEGRTAKQIALILESTVKTVEGWLKQRKE